MWHLARKRIVPVSSEWTALADGVGRRRLPIWNSELGLALHVCGAMNYYVIKLPCCGRWEDIAAETSATRFYFGFNALAAAMNE